MTEMLRLRPAVRWLPWTRVPFDRAQDEGKVILLSIVTAWSRACREMDEQCYADRSIADEINRWFVPVRVDADRRPDIADRYDLGGLPTTAFLTTDGEVLGGGTFVPPDRLREALTRLRNAPPVASGSKTSDQDPLGVGSQPPRKASADRHSLGDGGWELGVDSLQGLIDIVFGTFDQAHAGFGDAPKFPLAAPVRLALELFRESQSEAMADCATRTLDAMGWNGLYDDAEGGFFRCSARADWQGAQPEKLLVTNAVLLDLYLEAGVTMGSERWLARAADVLEYVQSRLASVPGEGWRASEESDGARFSDANALMVSSALHASRVFEDSSLRELALQSIESVLLSSYRPGQGVAHCGGGVRGLLTDQVAMANAQLDAWDLTGDVVYQMMAQELAHYAIRTLWDADQGGFFDRASSEDGDLGLLVRPLKPFVLNCEAAEVLHRLSRAVEDPELGRRASSTLDAIRLRAAQQGPLGAHYVLARRSLSR